MQLAILIDLIAGAVLGAMGICCLFIPHISSDVVYYTAAVLCTLSAIVLWDHTLRNKRGLNILLSVVLTILSLLFWFHSSLRAELIPTVFGFYMFFNAGVQLISYVLDVKDHAKNGWVHLISFVLYTGLSIASFHYRSNDLGIIMRVFGIYLLYQAIQLFIEMFLFEHPSSSRSGSFAYWAALPAYFVGVLPSLVLRFLLSKKMEKTRNTYDQKKNDLPVNLRVYIHTGLDGDHIYGHMTFSYHDVMYSYGNYDKAEEKFFRSIGPGVFFTVPAKAYVNNSCIYEGSTIFEFGLHLDSKQEQKLQKEIERIFKETYRWYCPIEKKSGGRNCFKEFENDYSCRLSYLTGAKFRKFYHGQWKTYWILGDNCSLFADDMLSKIGCHIVHKTGIVSPGEYFEFFTQKFQDPNSNVVYRSWHDARYPETLFKGIA